MPDNRKTLKDFEEQGNEMTRFQCKKDSMWRSDWQGRARGWDSDKEVVADTR